MTLLNAQRSGADGQVYSTHALLNGANLEGADLSGALLNNADLTGACLTGAWFRRAELRGATVDPATLADPSLNLCNAIMPDSSQCTRGCGDPDDMPVCPAP